MLAGNCAVQDYIELNTQGTDSIVPFMDITEERTATVLHQSELNGLEELA